MHSTYLQVQEGHNVPTGDYKTMSLEYRVQDGMLMVVATTAVRVPALQRQISEAETALSLLVGRIPGTVPFDVPASLSLPPLPSMIMIRVVDWTCEI